MAEVPTTSPAATTTEVTPMEEPPKSGKTVVATSWPVSEFQIDDKLTITKDGTELSATDAKRAFEAAKANGVKLVTVKEVSE